MRIISGLYKNRNILAPKGDIARPTASLLREALFNICQGYIGDAVFLDLFAGSGAMGLEALSRGASKATFIDNTKECVRCIEANIEALGIEKQADVLMGNVFLLLERLIQRGRKFDMIYADPPYDAVVKIKDEEIFYSGLVVKMVDEGNLLKDGGYLFIEDSKQARQEIESLKTIEFVGTRAMGRSVLHTYKAVSSHA